MAIRLNLNEIVYSTDIELVDGKNTVKYKIDLNSKEASDFLDYIEQIKDKKEIDFKDFFKILLSKEDTDKIIKKLNRYDRENLAASIMLDFADKYAIKKKIKMKKT